jgi:hypothetical protein
MFDSKRNFGLTFEIYSLIFYSCFVAARTSNVHD